MEEPAEFKKERTWPEKFRGAFQGFFLGVQGQKSFRFHFIATLLVIVAGTLLQVSLTEWCLLVFCITFVLTAEMFNSALETIAPAIDRRYNQNLAESLDISSAAVLLASCGAVVVGGIIFISRLVEMLS